MNGDPGAPGKLFTVMQYRHSSSKVVSIPQYNGAGCSLVSGCFPWTDRSLSGAVEIYISIRI